MRRAFSLFELLVILVVIAILIALLLPALAKVRQAAARTTDANNLKHIGLATHNFLADRGKFPVLVDYDKGTMTGGYGVASAFADLLPYLEQANLWQMYDPKNPSSFYDEKKGAARQLVKCYLSPSDPSAPDGATAKATVKAPGAKAPWAAEFTGLYATTSYAGNGLLFVKKVNTPAEVQDGLSMTSMFVERYQKCGKPGQEVFNLWGMGAFSASTPGYAVAKPTGEHPTAEPALAQFSPDKSVPDGPEVAGTSGGKAVKYGELMKGANAAGGFQVRPAAADCDPRVPQGLHANGMNVCYGDGSVRFLTLRQSPVLFWALATPRGGEAINDDF